MKPIDSNYSDQLTRYLAVLDTLTQVPSLAAHVVNIRKIIDDINMNIENNVLSADSNLTLTKIRAE